MKTHKHLLALSLFVFMLLSCTPQQQESTPPENIIRPILLDKSVLSGVGLQKIEQKNEPEKDFYQRRLYRGLDISIYVVSTETWNNKMDNFPFDEFIYMYHGEAIIKPQSGQAQHFYTGDYFFAPKGYTGEWQIQAGSNLHYELSVIATGRADTSVVSTNPSHQLFSRSTLSGAHIDLDEQDEFSEILKEGVELTIGLKAEKPSSKIIDNPAKEMIIQVLSGQITIEDKVGEAQVFYSGDFLIIPTGFTGKWNSEGHGLIKYLTVEKT